MTRWDEHDAECLVFTFKEGLLSKVAHDLMLRATRLVVELDAQASSVRVEVDATSLRVVTAMKDGREHRGALSEADHRKIEETIVQDVLDARRHPKIVFRATRVSGTGGRRTIEGELELRGRRARLTAEAELEAGRWVTEVALHQPDFGITPYRAMMGALRVGAAVRVRVSVPAGPG